MTGGEHLVTHLGGSFWHERRRLHEAGGAGLNFGPFCGAKAERSCHYSHDSFLLLLSKNKMIQCIFDPTT